MTLALKFSVMTINSYLIVLANPVMLATNFKVTAWFVLCLFWMISGEEYE